MKKRINVTTKDIMTGDVKNRRLCPVALAVKRHCKDSFGIVVESTCIFFNPIRGFYLPQIAVDFIEKFDSERPVSTFSFELGIPDEFVKVKK